LVLIAVGLVPLACWTVWFRTRTWYPVDIPISLSQGSHFSTGEFTINLNGRYEIEIETTNEIPLDTLHCLLGNGMRSKQSCSVPSVVNVHWALSGNGTVIQGTSDDTKEYGGEVGATGEASRTIGIFRGQKGRRYKLDCDVLADGSSLNATKPRLHVSFFEPSYETSLVVSGLLRLVCTITALIGGFTLIGSLLAQRRCLGDGILKFPASLKRCPDTKPDTKPGFFLGLQRLTRVARPTSLGRGRCHQTFEPLLTSLVRIEVSAQCSVLTAPQSPGL